jgi:hypothetical protein
LPKLWLLALAALGIALAGCADRLESAHFGPPATLERLIRQYYARYASHGGECFNLYIDGFTRFTVLEDTPDRLLVDVRYFRRDRIHNGENDSRSCIGFGERTFFLERDADGAPVVVGMSGEQDEPVVRSLIRRALRG